MPDEGKKKKKKEEEEEKNDRIEEIKENEGQERKMWEEGRKWIGMNLR